MQPTSLNTDRSHYFLARNQPTRELHRFFPREIFQMLAVNLCDGLWHSPPTQLSILSQVSWQWHQDSLHIDTVLALLNSKALNLTNSPLFNGSIFQGVPLQSKLLCSFIEVLLGERSIESFKYIQDQSQNDNSDSLNLSPQLDRKPTYIKKNLTTIDLGDLKKLKNLSLETFAALRSMIQCIDVREHNFPSSELLKLTRLVHLSVFPYGTFTLNLQPLTQLSTLNIDLLSQNTLPVITPENFSALKNLYISSLWPVNLDNASIAPKSLESIHFVNIKPSISFFTGLERLVNLKLQRTENLVYNHFLPKFPSLKKLFISINSGSKSADFLNFDMPQLQNLHLEDPCGHGFTTFSLNSTALQILYLDCPALIKAKFNSENLVNLKLKNIKNLKYDHFLKFPSLKRFFISIMSEGEPTPSFNLDMPRLEKLHLEDSSKPDLKQFSLNSTTLQTLYLKCPELREATFNRDKLKSVSIIEPKYLEEQLKKELPAGVFR